MHKVRSTTSKPNPRGIGWPALVTIECTCGTKARSKSGAEGTWRAFDKHVKRAG